MPYNYKYIYRQLYMYIGDYKMNKIVSKRKRENMCCYCCCKYIHEKKGKII